jgi:diguanylate cyclase (GGDEF)-like protein
LKGWINTQGFSLRFLISSHVILSLFLTLAISIVAGYNTSKHAMIVQTMETNRVYAEKLAYTAALSILSARKSLEITAAQLSLAEYKETVIQNHMDVIRKSGNLFNSIVYLDEMGTVRLTSPFIDDLAGSKSSSKAIQQALEIKKFYISAPYTGITGKLMLFMSAPVWQGENKLAGMLMGTIYLQENNYLSGILGNHFYGDGSYVYVIDSEGRYLYHPQKDKIGIEKDDYFLQNQAMLARNGKLQSVDEQGHGILLGYSAIEATDWRVIVRTPIHGVVEPAIRLVKETVGKMLPFFIILILLSWWFAHWIAAPMRSLSLYGSQLSRGEMNAQPPRFPKRYDEAVQLTKAILLFVGFIRKQVDHLTGEVYTDPLTGLANRREMDRRMGAWIEEKVPFSVIMIDLDNFKDINDTFGHQLGDEVLQFLAEQIRNQCRAGDLACRYGGEEFIILLPYADKRIAESVAESLRTKVSSLNSPAGHPITLSLGVSAFPEKGTNAHELLESADQALYTAKRNGKNQTIVS